jgi:transcriptional regulator with XRE-family HTH domain
VNGRRPRGTRLPPRRASRPAGTVVPRLREEFNLSRKTLARLTGLSERTLATWEAGGHINDAGQRAVTLAERLLHGLAEVIRPEALAAWLEQPNDGCGGLKPLEVVERGEADRLWRMIYFLGSGTAS